MKNIYKIISFLLVLTVCFGMSACSFGTSSEGQGAGSAQTPSGTSDGTAPNADNHVINVTKTSRFVVEDGVNTGYDILIPEDASEDIKTAASELQVLFLEATDVELQITSSYEEGRKYFSIGDTSLAEENGLSGDINELGRQGFRIKSIGDDIFIYSAVDLGCVYGVYDYLKYALNYEFFYTDTYSLNITKNLFFYDFDIKEVPDIAIRITTNEGFQSNEVTKRRMRSHFYYETFAYSKAGPWHNCLGVMNITENYAEHPEWFMNDSTKKSENQLCYTAHGNAEQYEQMVQYAVDFYYSELLACPDRNAVMLASEDNPYGCSCDTCNSYVEKYGELSSTLIIFLNDVAEGIEAKLTEANDTRASTFKLSFYAYLAYEFAPVQMTVGEDGSRSFSYSPDVVCNSHVAPLYATAWMGMVETVYSEYNKEYLESFYKWSEIADGLQLWWYDQYFKDSGFMMNYNTFYKMSELYQLAYECDFGWIYGQGQHTTNKESTCFGSLKAYLQSKLGWNCYLDVNTLIDDFFNEVYGSKSGEMRELFEEMVLLSERQVQDQNFKKDMTTWGHVDKLEWWPKNLLLDWYDRYCEIEAELLANGETEQAKMVRLEMVSPLYLSLKFYKNDLGSGLSEYIAKLKELTTEFEITAISEAETLSSFLSTLGQ